MRIVFFLILFINSANGYELWAHRLQEYAHPHFTHSNTCTEMPSNKLESSFNFNFLKTNKFKGVEVDAYYRRDLGKLIVFHGSKDFKDGSKIFQCFNGRYVVLEDFLNLFFNKFPNYKVWIDLKNQEFNEIASATNIIKDITRNEQVIVESKSTWGVIYLKSKSVPSSLWIQTRSKTLKSKYQAFKQSFYNNLKILTALVINPTRISQSCKMMTTLENIFDNNHKKMCWNTSAHKVSEQKISNIRALQVVLEGPKN